MVFAIPYLLLASSSPRSLAAGKIDPPEISVFAAASLKDAFTSISSEFEKIHPGIRVLLNFAGSQTLASQISQGAPADVFASASIKTLMEANPDVDSVRYFAHNRLIIVVRKGFSGIASPRDLVKAKNLVLADVSVPAGSYAGTFLDSGAKLYGPRWSSSVRSHIVSRELDVRAVLTKVIIGEADAGIVYVSDAASAKSEVQTVDIPETINPVAKYPVALTTSAANKDGAKDFVKFLFQPQEQAILEANGFISPLRPVAAIDVRRDGRLSRIKLPLRRSLHEVTIQASGHGGVVQSFTGVPIDDLISKKVGTVTITGADEYAKTFKRSELAGAKAILVRLPDGNYQIVVAGLKPFWWVKWIRRIDLR